MEKTDHERIKELEEEILMLTNRTRAMQTNMAKIIEDMIKLKEKKNDSKK